MKKVILFSLSLLILQGIHAQSIQLSFKGSGLSTMVESVQVKNLISNAEVTLQQGDVLQLAGITGITNFLKEKSGLLMYPNPMSQSGTIEFYTRSTGSASIEIYNIIGKIVSRSINNLSAGLHSFSLEGLSKGIYTVRISTPDQVFTGALFSDAVNSGRPMLNFTGSTDVFSTPGNLKSGEAVVEMLYNAGEHLLIKGISGDYSRVLTHVPTENATIDFEFIECRDGNGNHYSVVTIGTQTWMAENLRATNYPDEQPIPIVNSNALWASLTPADKAFCWYQDDPDWGSIFGALYTWAGAMNGATSSGAVPSGVQGVCPEGWHLPSDAEWLILENYLADNGFNYDGTTGGGREKINKAISSNERWASTSVTGSPGSADYREYGNKSGFGALAAGVRRDVGTSGVHTFHGRFWTTTQSSSSNAYGRSMGYNYSNVIRNFYGKTWGYSIRCLKDMKPPDEDPTPGNPELIFHSGFEPDVVLTTRHDRPRNVDIHGIDRSLPAPNDWVNHLQKHPYVTNFIIDYEQGDDTQRKAEIVKDPVNPYNHALWFWIKEPHSGNPPVKGRVQSTLSSKNPGKGLKNFYYSVRMFLPDDFQVLKNSTFQSSYLTLMEYWNNAPWEEDYGFRITLGLSRGTSPADGDPIRFRVNGERRDMGESYGLYNISNNDFEVPIGKWMKMEVWMVEGDNNTGRYILRVTPDGEQATTVFNITNYTQNPLNPNPDGFTIFDPFKLYTAGTNINFFSEKGKLMNIYWDDFEIWHNRFYSE